MVPAPHSGVFSLQTPVLDSVHCRHCSMDLWPRAESACLRHGNFTTSLRSRNDIVVVDEKRVPLDGEKAPLVAPGCHAHPATRSFHERRGERDMPPEPSLSILRRSPLVANTSNSSSSPLTPVWAFPTTRMACDSCAVRAAASCRLSINLDIITGVTLQRPRLSISI
jgi:hypothetical protein